MNLLESSDRCNNHKILIEATVISTIRTKYFNF